MTTPSLLTNGTQLRTQLDVDTIPVALRKRTQWVLWRLEPKKGKPDELTKVPYTEVSKPARSNDPRTWLPFEIALARYLANPRGWAGIGYVFAGDDPYTGLDLDNSLHAGAIALWAQAILDDLMPTYAEVSPSGTGIKLWVETAESYTLGSEKDGHQNPDGQVEIYSAGRFFAVTGLAIDGAPGAIAQASSEKMARIIAAEQARRAARRPARPAPAPLNGTHANGTHAPLELDRLVSALQQIHPDRWAGYDSWLRIGMFLHDWAEGDSHRLATAYALFDQYSKERAPEYYGQTLEKWESFGKRTGVIKKVTIGTLLRWAQEDRTQQPATPPEPPHPAGDSADELDQQEVPQLGLVSSFPELPASAQLPKELGQDACPWLDEYIRLSRHWSPRSYDGFHEACGLWLLSTIAARRVMLPLGGARYTNLYIALAARTSLWAKSTAAKIAIETIRAAGLGQLLAPDDATPQAFIDRLVARLPGNWADLEKSARDALTTHLAFAGQRGWFFEEFGEKLSAMMRDGSVMADYRGHFRRFDDCPLTYSYATISRGMNSVERPYLALLANLTPADLAPFARKGSSLWGDGFFARYAFITPPTDAERSRARFPHDERHIPVSLTQPLQEWHRQLGIPAVDVTERHDEKGRPTSEYSLSITPVEPQRCTLGAGVFDAYYRYLDALADLVDAGANTDLDGSYTRFAEKALRIAMLLASLSNGGRIELSHWARAQQIAERWRQSLHHLVDQLGQSDDSPDRVLEDKLNRVFARHPSLTARDAGRSLHISTGEAERLLEQLLKAGVLQVDPGKRTKRYHPVASVASVTLSQVSHPAQNRDSSASYQGDGEEVSQDLEGCDGVTPVTVATLPREHTSSGEEVSQDLEGCDGVTPVTVATLPQVRSTPTVALRPHVGDSEESAWADLARRYEAARGYPPVAGLWTLQELAEQVALAEHKHAA